jgi:hypothetical protein
MPKMPRLSKPGAPLDFGDSANYGDCGNACDFGSFGNSGNSGNEHPLGS